MNIYLNLRGEIIGRYISDIVPRSGEHLLFQYKMYVVELVRHSISDPPGSNQTSVDVSISLIGA